MIFECSDRREARDLRARLRAFVDERGLAFVARVQRERAAVSLTCSAISDDALEAMSRATGREVARGEIFASRWAALAGLVGARDPGAIEPALVLAALPPPVPASALVRPAGARSRRFPRPRGGT